MRLNRPHRAPRGLTLVEVAIAVIVVVAMLAAMLPMLGSGMLRSGVMVSANNLRTIAAGCVAYEADWNGRVFTLMDAEMGRWPGCTAFTARRCPPQAILGNGEGAGALWAYWIRGSQPACQNYPGNCGNWPVLMPMALGGTTGSLSTTSSYAHGTWQYPNIRGLREYVCARFFDPVFYAPNDTVTFGGLQAGAFSSTAEFDGYLTNAFAFDWRSSYGLSPAAMWGPGVFRAPSQGGFQSPDTYHEAYFAPTATMAVHPSLKTRIMEKRWCQQPPALGRDGTTAGAAYQFNAGPGSQPGAIFFDGHVSFTAMSEYAADDADARAGGGDGLWSRDTPYGPTGVWGSEAIGGFAASPHLLTTDGIAGRDLTHVR